MLKLGDCDKYDCPVSSTSNYAGAITDIRFLRATSLRNVLQEYVVSGEGDQL